MKSVYSNGYELNEGGHAVKSTPVRNDMALRMINWLQNGIKSFTGLETASAGSAGKKHDDEFSGDIDIIVGSEPDKGISAIRGYITDAFGKGIETKESKGFNLLSCSLPFKDEKGNISYVQVDFFFYSDIRMADFFYHSPDYRSENPSAFKGSVRNRLLSEIASAIPTGKKPIYFDSTDYVKEFWKYSYTPQGLMLKHKSFEGKKGHMNRNSHTVKEDTRKVTSDPSAIIRFLLGEKATEKDTDSFESIISFMNSGNFRFPELKDKIFKNLVSGDDDPDERQRIEHFLTGKADNRKLSESINTRQKNLKNTTIIDKDKHMVRKLSADIEFAKFNLGSLPENIDEFNHKSEEFINRLLKKNTRIKLPDYQRYYTCSSVMMNPVSGYIDNELLFFPSESKQQTVYVQYDSIKTDVSRYTGNNHIKLTIGINSASNIRNYNIRLTNAYFKKEEPLMTDDGVSFIRYLYFLKTIYSKKYIDIMNICDLPIEKQDFLFFKKYTKLETMSDMDFFSLVMASLFLYGLNHEFPDIFTTDNFIKVQKYYNTSIYYQIYWHPDYHSDNQEHHTYKYILQVLKIQLENIWHYWFSGETDDLQRKEFIKKESIILKNEMNTTDQGTDNDMPDNHLEIEKSHESKTNDSLLETFHYFNKKLSESINSRRKAQGSSEEQTERRNKAIIKDTIDSIKDNEYKIPEKIKNEFYNDIAPSEDERNQAAVELGNSIINSIGNYQNKKSIKNYYSVIIERGANYSMVIRTMIFEKFKEFNSKVPFYKFNIKLLEYTKHKERPITSWRCYIHDMTLQIPLFARQLDNYAKTIDNLQIIIHETDENQDENISNSWIPYINRNSYIQLISEAKLFVSPEFYDFICKLSSVKIPEKIIERFQKKKIQFHTGIFQDIIIRMISQKFPKVFHRLIDIENVDMQLRDPKWKKIEIFLKDYLMGQMYGNKGNKQQDSNEIIDESINSRRKAQGSSEEQTERRNKAIINDITNQFIPFLSKKSIDEFTDFIIEKYIKTNPYIKDYKKDYNSSINEIRYIQINDKNQHTCEYKICLTIQTLDLSWPSNILKQNDLDVEHVFYYPNELQFYAMNSHYKSDKCTNKYDYFNEIHSFKNSKEIIETINKHFLIVFQLQLNLIRIAVCPSTVNARYYYLTHDPGKITRTIIEEWKNLDKGQKIFLIPELNGLLDGISFLLYMFPDKIRSKIVNLYLKNCITINLSEEDYNLLFNEYDKYFSSYRKKAAGEFFTEF